MSNLGLGIGSFIQGLTNGANIARQWERDDLEAKYKEKHMKLLENQDARETAKDARDATETDRKFKLLESQDARAAAKDARDAEKDSLEIGWKKEDRAVAVEERAANAPVKEAQRKSILGKFNDENAEKDARREAGAAAEKEFKDNPQKYGSFADAFRSVSVPRIQEFYLSRGDTASADAFQKWSNDKRVEKGVESFGKVIGAAQIGDWAGVNEHFNKLTTDPSYMALDGYEIKTSPIEVDGKTVGLRGTFKNKQTGEEEVKDFSDMNELMQTVTNVFNPKSAYEWNKSQMEAQSAARAERAKEKNKLADQIELDNAKTKNQLVLEGQKSESARDLKAMEVAGRIAEERAKAGGPQAIKDYANGVLQVMKFQSENNPGFAKLPADQQAAQSAQIYEQVRARSGQGVAPQSPVPTSRTMAPQAPAAAPMARSIMPFSPPGPFVPET